MIRLISTEFRRLMSRRMTLGFPAGTALLIAGGVVIAYFVIENGKEDGDAGPDFIADIAGGVELTSLFQPIAFLIPLMAFVIGASYFGADVKTGVIEQILTWEPRRLRLIAARVVSAIVGVAILAMILTIFFVILMYGLAASTGTTGGLTGEFWGNLAGAIVRLGIAAGLFAAFGLGITVIVNNSLASIVGFVIYFFIIDGVIGAFLGSVAPYTPVTNTSAFASATDVEKIEGSVFVEDVSTVFVHGYRTAGLIMAAYVVAAVAAGALLFQRRDID